MDDQQAPTLMDIAKLVSTPVNHEHYPELRPTLMWLIRSSPKAQAVYDELTHDTRDRPTLLELAKLLCVVETGAKYPECRHTVLWLIKQNEAAKEVLTELEHLATDAGDDLDGAMWVLRAHQDTDRLLAVEDWDDDPADVVDPTRSRGRNYEPCFNICTARLARGEGDRSRLETVIKKLERYLELDRYLPRLSDRIKNLKDLVADSEDPLKAAETLEGMAAALRVLGATEEKPDCGTEALTGGKDHER